MNNFANTIEYSKEDRARIRKDTKELSNIVTQAKKMTDEEKELYGTFDVLFTTEQLNRNGAIIKTKGMTYKNFLKQPIMLVNHNSTGEAAGVFTELSFDKNGNGRGKGVFLPTAVGQTERVHYDFGLGATSIGVLPIEVETGDEGERIITKSDLIEISIVREPANTDVEQVLSKHGLDKVVASFKKHELADVEDEDEQEEMDMDEDIDEVINEAEADTDDAEDTEEEAAEEEAEDNEEEDEQEECNGCASLKTRVSKLEQSITVQAPEEEENEDANEMKDEAKNLIRKAPSRRALQSAVGILQRELHAQKLSDNQN